MSEHNGNGSKVWEFTKWVLAFLIIAGLSLANIVHQNSLSIKDNTSSIISNTQAIKSNQELTNLQLAYIISDVAEIKALLKEKEKEKD